MIIYLTINLINFKFYVGKDKNNNPNYLGSGKILRQSIKKYGKENFSKIVIEECNELNLSEREIYWIEFFEANIYGYNIAKGGEGGDTISNHPDKLLIAKNHSNLMKSKNYEHLIGRKLSKKIYIEGGIYEGYSDVIKILGLTLSQIRTRIKSVYYPEYYHI